MRAFVPCAAEVEQLEARLMLSSFQGIGMLTGFVSSGVAGVSPDGTVAVGDSGQAVKWSAGTAGIQPLPTIAGVAPTSDAWGVSSNGTIIAGDVLNKTMNGQATILVTQAAIWTSSGIEPLPFLSPPVLSGGVVGGPFTFAQARGVTPDGATVVGYDYAAGVGVEAFRYNVSSGAMLDLAHLANGGYAARAYAISSNGSIVVGSDFTTNGGGVTTQDPVIWVGTPGNWTVSPIPSAIGTNGEAFAVSGDGSVVVGQSGGQAFEWTKAGGLVPIGGTEAEGISNGGTTIVGTDGSHALIWNGSTTPQNLQAFLVANYGLGTALNGWTLTNATAITPDGSTIVGTGIDPQGHSEGWIVHLVLGYTPAEIRHAYGFDAIPFLENNGQPDAATYNSNAGAGQTIAIVVDYDDPSIAADLMQFDNAYGLPTASLTKVNELGQVINGLSVVPPAADPSTAFSNEESLDVEWAHAIAPAARIIVVECNSISTVDLFQGMQAAANYPGVSVVSISQGEYNLTETDAENIISEINNGYDGKYLSHPGVTFVASSGDGGAIDSYPAISPNVLSVGGTTLTLNADNSYNSESGWILSGGGASEFESEPAYQLSVQTTGIRTFPDVAFDANPATAVSIYNSSNSQSNNPWISNFSGTSLGAPSWAGLVAIVNQARASAGEPLLNSSTSISTLAAVYTMPSTDFHKILGDANGSSTIGLSNAALYNEVTGLGTPIANLLVPDLVTYSGVLATPILQQVTTGSILLGSFSVAGVGAGPYSGSVNWGDGTNDTSGEANSPLSITVANQTVQIFGSHAFARSGLMTVAVSLTTQGGSSVTRYASAEIAADVSSGANVSRSGLTYNRSTRLFYGSVTITNTSSKNLGGSFDVLLQGLTSGASLTYASVTIGSVSYALAISDDSAGDSYIHIPRSLFAMLAPGQSVVISLRFSDPSLMLIGFNTKVFSDPFDS